MNTEWSANKQFLSRINCSATQKALNYLLHQINGLTRATIGTAQLKPTISNAPPISNRIPGQNARPNDPCFAGYLELDKREMGQERPSAANRSSAKRYIVARSRWQRSKKKDAFKSVECRYFGSEPVYQRKHGSRWMTSPMNGSICRQVRTTFWTYAPLYLFVLAPQRGTAKGVVRL